MKILKFFGWALLGLFVIFLVLLIITAIFDYFTDDMEVKAVERTLKTITEDTVTVFCAYMPKNLNTQITDQLFSDAANSDIVLLQNGEDAQTKMIESMFQKHNIYFSFTRRTPFSFTSKGRMAIMDFSGLYSLTSISPSEVRKLLLPTDTNWFNSLLSPTPSLQILEFQIKDELLYLINLDNEMNDQFEPAELNLIRLDYIRESIIETLPEDARILIAGNWNNLLPGQMMNGKTTIENQIPLDWTKTGWQWIYPPEETAGYGVLVSDNLQIDDISFPDLLSGMVPKVISFTLSFK